MLADHLRVEVADAVRIHLARWCSARRQPSRIVISLKIAHQRRGTFAPACVSLRRKSELKGKAVFPVPGGSTPG